MSHPADSSFWRRSAVVERHALLAKGDPASLERAELINAQLRHANVPLSERRAFLAASQRDRTTPTHSGGGKGFQRFRGMTVAAPILRAAGNRPAVPSSPGAIPGGPTEEEQEMGLFSFLGKIGGAAIGVAEGITGIDVPFIGPGDRFFGGGSSVPGGQSGLTVQGLANPCDAGFVLRNGRCERGGIVGRAQRALPGGSTGLQTTGRGSMVAGMGGWNPVEVPTSRADCGRGAVLGRDGLCYDKRNIRNSERMWPKGRKPLLTGGDLNCIAKASRAANRLKTQTKRLQKMGMLQRPRGRR